MDDTTYKNSGKERRNNMDFLKALFNGKPLTYEELEQAINAHNGNEANKEAQIKVGNLGGGEYVGKAKYDALQALLNGKNTELETANGTIAELKKATKGNEELQGKFTDYENQIANLQAENAKIKLQNALKFSLLEAKAVDVDYLIYKAEEKLKAEGKTLELDENEKVKGCDDLISGLKVQFPAQFDAAASGRKVDPLPLPKSEGSRTGEPKTLAEAIQQSYENKN